MDESFNAADENQQDAHPSSTAPPPQFSTYTQVSFVQQFIGPPVIHGPPAVTSTSHHLTGQLHQQFIVPPTLPGSPRDLKQFIRNALQSGAGHPFGAAPPTPTLQIGASTHTPTLAPATPTLQIGAATRSPTMQIGAATHSPTLQIGASTQTPTLATHTQTPTPTFVTAPPTHQHPPDLISTPNLGEIPNILLANPVLREQTHQFIDTKSVCFHHVATTFSLDSLISEFTRFGGYSFIEAKWHGLTGGHIYVSFKSVAMKDNVLLDPPNLGPDMVVHSASERLSCDLCNKAREFEEF